MVTLHAASGELIDIYPFGEALPQAYIKGQTNGAALLRTLRDGFGNPDLIDGDHDGKGPNCTAGDARQQIGIV